MIGMNRKEKSPRHILFVHPKLSFGGGERVLVEQIAALAGLPVQVSVLFKKDGHRRDLESEIRARNPNIKAIIQARGFLACVFWLLRWRPDGIVLNGHRSCRNALRFLSCFGLRFPLMVTQHEHYAHHLRAYRKLAPLVDVWLCCYDFGGAIAQVLGKAPCVVVHPLYPREALAWGEGPRREARFLLGLPERGLVVGYVGRQDTNKEPWQVIRFAELLQESSSRAVWVILAGQEAPGVSLRLDEVVAASPLRSRIKRLHWMADNGPAFAALDLFVMTSYSEGYFPLSVMEALERGVPAAVTTVGGMPQLLRDGEGSFFIHKPDDQSPVSEESLREAVGRLAPELLSGHAWELQRCRAAEAVFRVRDGYDAGTLYRKAFLGLMASHRIYTDQACEEVAW